MDMMEVADPDAVYAVRTFIRKELASQLKSEFLSTVCYIHLYKQIFITYRLVRILQMGLIFFVLLDTFNRLRTIEAQRSMYLTILIWPDVPSRILLLVCISRISAQFMCQNLHNLIVLHLSTSSISWFP